MFTITFLLQYSFSDFFSVNKNVFLRILIFKSVIKSVFMLQFFPQDIHTQQILEYSCSLFFSQSFCI